MPTAETIAIAADDQRPLPGSGSTGWLDRSLLARMLDVLECAREGACIIETKQRQPPSGRPREHDTDETTTHPCSDASPVVPERRNRLRRGLRNVEAEAARAGPTLTNVTPFGASYARTVKLWNKVGSVDVVQFCLSHG